MSAPASTCRPRKHERRSRAWDRSTQIVPQHVEQRRLGRGIGFVAAAIDVQHEAHTARPNAPSRGIRTMALSRSMARNS
jgi:hypothetical protein